MEMIFMAYISGSVEAVDFYCKAFDATSRNCFKAQDEDDFYAHAEIVIDGKTVLAICDTAHAEANSTDKSNSTFWLKCDSEIQIANAYNVLKENAIIHTPLSTREWSNLMADFTDKYGIRWLLSYEK